MRPARQCLAGFCVSSKLSLTHLTGVQPTDHLAMAGEFDLLEAFGLDPGIIEILKEKYGPELLPIQEKAFKEHQILAGGNFIIFAVTSDGKALVGEIPSLFNAGKGGKKRGFSTWFPPRPWPKKSSSSSARIMKGPAFGR